MGNEIPKPPCRGEYMPKMDENKERIKIPKHTTPSGHTLGVSDKTPSDQS